MATATIERRCSSRAPTSAIDTLWAWAMRSLRLLTTCRLSLSENAEGIESSSCRTPMVMGFLRFYVFTFYARRSRLKRKDVKRKNVSLPLQRPLDRLPDVRLEHVADLDVVVVGQLDAALEAGLDLADVLLHAAEGLDGEVLGDDRAAAGEADLAAALDVAVGDEAAGDVAEAADFEHLADLDVACSFSRIS